MLVETNNIIGASNDYVWFHDSTFTHYSLFFCSDDAKEKVGASPRVSSKRTSLLYSVPPPTERPKRKFAPPKRYVLPGSKVIPVSGPVKGALPPLVPYAPVGTVEATTLGPAAPFTETTSPLLVLVSRSVASKPLAHTQYEPGTTASGTVRVWYR
jgi:hypothetical protein